MIHYSNGITFNALSPSPDCVWDSLTQKHEGSQMAEMTTIQKEKQDL